jgi:3-methyladenine DNA glycosylase AlkD
MSSSPEVQNLKAALQALADPEIAQHSRRFFKSGPGEYAEGDKFYGIRVPEQRKLAKKFAKDFDLASLSLLIKDDYHEARLTGVLILVLKYQKAKGEAQQKAIVDFFLEHRDWVNNWDLVDSSAHKILGEYLAQKREYQILLDLARQDHLWSQRIAIMSTFAFIPRMWFEPTFEIAELLLEHPHDLIHKALGWMIREVGNKDHYQELEWLEEHHSRMPRTMLRYAIEKFPETKRKAILAGTFFGQ